MKRFPILLATMGTIFFVAGCSPAATPAPTAEPTATPIPVGITLYYENNAQVELIDFQGARVLIDVYSSADLSSPPTEKDILLITHKHMDHYDIAFDDEFPGPKIIQEAGELHQGDISVRSALSTGDGGYFYPNTLMPDGNAIFVIDIGGLRVAHLGDIAQAEFTPEQLSILHGVDIAVVRLDSLSDTMSLKTKNGFTLVGQIQPKIVITNLNTTPDAFQYAVDLWGAYSLNGPLRIDRAGLPAETTLVIMGSMAETYKSIFKLTDWNSTIP